MKLRQKEKSTSYSAYRNDLQTGQFRSFLRYLFPSLPQLSLTSLNAGLGTANLATAIAGLGGIAMVGAAGVTLVGTAVVSAVCGVMGTLAVVLGVISLKREYDKNKEDIKTVVGDGIQEGQAGELKKMLAYVTEAIGQNPDLESDELDTLLFSLAAIRGRNLRQKCYDVYGVNTGDVASDEAVLCNEMRAILDPENQKHISLESMHLALGVLSEKFENTIELFTQEINAALEQGDREQIQRIIGKLNGIPGGKFYNKIKCLYGPDPQEIDPVRLHNAIKSEIQQQYFELLIAFDEVKKGLRREDLTPRIEAFKTSLSLLKGIDNKSKMETLFAAGPLQGYSASNAFKEGVARHLIKVTEESDAEPDDTDSTALIAIHRIETPVMSQEDFKIAKNYMETELFTDSFMTPLDYAKKYFNALAGGMTGFGVVMGIAILAGVTIATGGAGLGVLIGAIALAAVGFSFAIWYTNYTKKRDLRIRKEIQTAKNVITQACEHGNKYLDQVYGPTNKISPVSELDFGPEHESDHESTLTEDQRNIRRLTREIAVLRAQLPPTQEKGKEEIDVPLRRSEVEEPRPPASPELLPLSPLQRSPKMKPTPPARRGSIQIQASHSPSMKKHGHFKKTSPPEENPSVEDPAAPTISIDRKKE